MSKLSKLILNEIQTLEMVPHVLEQLIIEYLPNISYCTNENHFTWKGIYTEGDIYLPSDVIAFINLSLEAGKVITLGSNFLVRHNETVKLVLHNYIPIIRSSYCEHEIKNYTNEMVDFYYLPKTNKMILRCQKPVPNVIIYKTDYINMEIEMNDVINILNYLNFEIYIKKHKIHTINDVKYF